VNVSTPDEIELVLAGGGHAHVAVLRRLAMAPWPGVRVTLVSREIETPYSGMLPGLVAGHYDFDAVHIDLGPLAEAGRVRLIHGEVDALDVQAGRIGLRDRPALRFDVLSLDTGATPVLDSVAGARGRVLPVKPISRFLPRLNALLARLHAMTVPMDLAVVGAGPAGVELILALAERLDREGLRVRARLHLVCAGVGPLPDLPDKIGRRFLRELHRRGIALHTGFRVAAVDAAGLEAEDGRRLDAQEMLWATQAGAPSWASRSALAVDAAGFVAVGPTLQSLSHPDVFAAGDVAALTHAPRPKSGVYAVRAGPVLARNLEAWIRGRRLTRYRPQRRALYLVSTGDRRAVVVHPALPAFSGRWVWSWKDRIDRRFMQRFSRVVPMAPEAPRSIVGRARGGGRVTAGMRCTGCGAKIGSGALSGALARAQGAHAANRFEDAAALEVEGVTVHQTMDGFPLPVADFWLGGRITALHALGDLHAMGADPLGALALATVPYAASDLMEEDLAQLMAGARSMLDEHDCPLLGGHSCEGAAGSLGLALTGRVPPAFPVLGKGGARAGDVLLLTKALGTGVVLAAAAAGRLRSRYRVSALASMLVSNAAVLPILRRHGARAATDVTGFGLLGHSLEMAEASSLSIRLDVAAPVPLPGALEALRAGEASSLQPENERLLEGCLLRGCVLELAEVRLLCDPQTCGGLLVALPAPEAAACLEALQAAGFGDARRVGTLEARTPGTAPVTLELAHGA
jgi:selenide,water dikinase